MSNIKKAIAIVLVNLALITATMFSLSANAMNTVAMNNAQKAMELRNMVVEIGSIQISTENRTQEEKNSLINDIFVKYRRTIVQLESSNPELVKAHHVRKDWETFVDDYHGKLVRNEQLEQYLNDITNLAFKTEILQYKIAKSDVTQLDYERLNVAMEQKLMSHWISIYFKARTMGVDDEGYQLDLLDSTQRLDVSIARMKTLKGEYEDLTEMSANLDFIKDVSTSKAGVDFQVGFQGAIAVLISKQNTHIENARYELDTVTFDYLFQNNSGDSLVLATILIK